MTSLEMGMAFMLGLTLLTAVSALVLPNDPLRMTRVLLAVGSALVFQLHVLFEGPQVEHWPLYGLGFVVLIAVAAHWFASQRGEKADEDTRTETDAKDDTPPPGP